MKHKAYSYTDFLASFGGLLGLIAGASLISLVEVFYFIFFIMIQKISELRKSSKINANTEEIRLAWTEETAIRRHIPDFVKVFLKKCSIHGVNQSVDEDQNLFGKLIWIVVVLTSSIVCGLLIKNYVKKSNINPVGYEIDEKLWSAEEVLLNKIQHFSRNK